MKTFREIFEKVELMKKEELKQFVKDNGYILGVRKKVVKLKDIDNYLDDIKINKIQVSDSDLEIVGELQRNDKSENSKWIYIKK